MTCAWKELLAVLPTWMRKDVNVLGADSMQELRLRINAPPELVCRKETRWLERPIAEEDLHYTINAASRYSPWAAATVSQGYITAAGGHRIGLCGEAVVHNGEVKGLRKVRDLCIRVARDFPGIAGGISGPGQSALILGPPGWGKTTLLRDLIRRRSDAGEHVAVVDERGELFPDDSFPRGRCTDVVSGCTKVQGIDSLLKTMGPDCIAVDEITSQTDCEAIQKAVGCGVSLLATAHGRSLSDLKSRPIYRPLLETPLVECVLVLRKDKSWRLERMEV
jgi:stage III sporulation protein AA